MTDLPDAEARRCILTDFGETLFVEAAAGTGKTTALVGRIVALIRDGLATLDQVVAVTFTEKAAGEMKLRLRTKIERVRQGCNPEQQGRLDQALRELELTRINTIHSFCGDLLRERPVEAEVDPLFEIVAEDKERGLADEAFDRWFEAALANPPEGVRRILRRRAKGQRPREILRSALDGLLRCRDFPARWRRDPFDRDRRIDALFKELKELGDLAATSSWKAENLTKNLAEIARFVEENTQLETVRGRDHDGLEAALRDLARAKSWKRKGAQKVTFGALSRDEVLSRRDRAKADLDALMAASDADLAPLLHEELQAAVNAYQDLKAGAGQLDFLDLLIKARDLIRDNESIRTELQKRFTHYFVDEFQDTDPLQAEILLLLAANDASESDWRKVQPVPGKLFLVGDPKQSIYRFRRADVELYEQVKKFLVARGAKLLHLTTSFRAFPSIQSFVNSSFAPAITADPAGGHPAYVPLQPSRPEITGQPTLVALPVPRPYGDYGTVVNWRIDESYPDAVGAFIAWLVNESGWTVEEDGKWVAVSPRHVCILFRRFRNFSTDVTRSYVRALEARRVPHVLVGGRSFYNREEILALCNALNAIEWPDDELRVFATLRGPFFALRDDALLAFRQHKDANGIHTRRLHPMHKVDRENLDEDAQPVADALDLLAKLHVGRNHRPIAQTITMLLDGVRAHAGVALWPTGEQALANCARLVDLARRFEPDATSFRSFVERMEGDAKRGDAGDALIVEEGTEGVRMITVHKAKGLEFPIVVVADPTCPAAWTKPTRHVVPERRLWLQSLCGCAPIELLEAAGEELQRDQAEAVRLAYVAATRARDLLVVPALGDKPMEGWLEVLNPTLYPPQDARRNSSPAPGCPDFGDDSVLDRGPKGVPPPGGSIRPGLHPSIGDKPEVVWWDPAVLALNVEEEISLRQQRILEADPEGTASAASEENYTRWKRERDEVIAQASRPSIEVQTVTSASRGAAEDERVRVEVVAHPDPERPGGRRFGALVHAVLAAIDLNASSEETSVVTRTHGRLVGATKPEIEAAMQTVIATLAHPVMRRAASVATGNLRRETPVLLQRKDGKLLEGVVDLAFREAAADLTEWTVVDFKTDREFEPHRGEYTTQLALYADAISQATRCPAKGILLVI